MMRSRRRIHRVLIGLILLCMMLKIQLELKVLESTPGTFSGAYAPWWTNETLGHIRAFPKATHLPHLPIENGQVQESQPKGSILPTNISDIKQKTGSHKGASSPPSQNKNNQKVPKEPYINNKFSNLSIHVYKNGSLNASLHSQDFGGKNSTVQAARNFAAIIKNKVIDSKPITNKVIDSKPIISSTKLDSVVKKNSQPLVNSLEKKNNIVKKATHVKKNLFSRLVLLNDGKLIESDNTDKIQEVIEIPKAKIENTKEGNTKTNAQKETNTKNIKGSLNKSMREALSVVKTKAKTKPKKAVLQRGVSHEVDSKEVSLNKEEIRNIKTKINIENGRQTIYNLNLYGPVLSNTTILLVQVHKRLYNLQYLVTSLKTVRGIKQSLVIFSHDFWDPAMNEFVRNITDFRVMQIFFPFSIQLHPFVYPGRDPRDCTWNVNRRAKLSCLNKDWPDTYGHYREAAFTQIKHHWWWKIHRVFEGLRVTKTNYSGHVVFLEEDHYVAPDLLHLLELMNKLKPTLCKDCKVIALGNYNKLNANVYKNYVERGDWWVTKYNLGFALDSITWREIKKCSEKFCKFDDYNWDWTMTNMVQTCHKPRMTMFSVRLSRVVHVGSCGTHVKKNGCDVRTEVLSAANRISSGKKFLFPKTLVLQNANRNSGKPKNGNGGWGDYRDRQLCLAIANGTATETTIDALQFGDRPT